uniref:Major facilitator superfamily (MFS) profile domain-containing protein n=1 Tax=Acrobeloides nanus TaxID=290746 RepID=A0A914EIE5_9BILA
MLIIGRLMIGVYTSIGTSLMPIFIQELAPPNIKGALSCFVHIAVCGGSALGAILSIDFILGNKHTWHILLALPAIFGFAQVILGIMLPDSPNHLLDSGDKRSAIRSIKFYYCFQNFDDDVAIQEYQQLVTHLPKQISVSKAFKEPKTRKGILLGMVVSFTQVFCGSMATVAYSTAMFTSVSFTKVLVPYMPALGSLFSILLTLPALRLVETCGRKPLLINTLILCALANFMLMGFSLVSQQLGVTWSSIGFTLAFFIFGLGYNLGTGPVSYFIPAELVRPEAAGVSLGCAVAVNWLSAMITTLIYYPLNVQVGGYSYLLFAIPTTIAILILQKWLPNNGHLKELSQNGGVILTCNITSLIDDDSAYGTFASSRRSTAPGQRIPIYRHITV